jgi:hypothetical protein
LLFYWALCKCHTDCKVFCGLKPTPAPPGRDASAQTSLFKDVLVR